MDSKRFKFKHFTHVTKTTIIGGTVPEILSQAEFFVILGHFLSFDPLNNPKNQNLEKIKKTPRDIIILHLCTTNSNHMIDGS